MTDFKTTWNKKVKEIDVILESYLPAEEGYQKTVTEAMNYSIRAGGKRLRPMLAYETYCLFGGADKLIEPFMAALEMVHTYSLVHDDLPAMDNDDYRRGRKTTHVVYGHGMGILAGDGLLNFAFETALKAFDLLSREASDYSIMLERLFRAQQILAEKAGIYGMLGGQAVDVEATEKKLPADKDRLDFIYRLKTGALIESAMLIGAVLAGASEEEQGQVSKAALEIGLAFQIQDDILDVTGSMEVLGKPVFSDERNEKTTYVSLLGLEASQKLVEDLTNQALERIRCLNGKNEFLEALLIWLVHREK